MTLPCRRLPDIRPRRYPWIMKIQRVLLAAILAVITASSFAQTQSPWNMTPRALPGTVQAEEYDLGGQNVAYFDTSAGNVFGAFRTEDMDVGAIPAGGHHIGFLADGEWAEYTVSVGATAAYTVTLRYASDYAGATSFRLLQDGVALTTQTLTKTSVTAGDWHNYVNKTFTVNLTAGTRVLRVEFTQGAWNFDSLSFAQQTTCTAPTITTQPAGVVANQPGGTHTFTAAASNAVSYQWFRNGQAIAGATSTSHQRTNLEQGKDGGDYFLRATSSCGATRDTSTVRIRVRCSASPALITRNIYRALRTEPDFCDWNEDMAPNFPYSNTDVNGSYNKPVLAAAVAFIKEPVRTGSWDMNVWWTDYLKGELGLRGTAWYFGGSELGSFTYSYFNVISVMAVYTHATRPNQPPQVVEIGNLAKRWLRANFALNALAAVPAWPKTKHDADGARQAMGNPYTGPWVAMAGERSVWGHWSNSHRSVLFARAVSLATNEGGEDPHVKDTRKQIENMWLARTGDALAGYGLASGERTTLRTIMTNGTLPSNLVSYYLGSELRTKTRYHFVAWQSPELVRATLMEQNAHQFTVPTMGVVYYTNPRIAGGAGGEARFLYPWQGVFGATPEGGVTTATGVLDLVNRFIESSNNAPVGSTHGPITKRISNLPSTARAYWVTINPEVNVPPTVR